ncbi:MAG TPA: thiol:disulfide interchange protein DsbA/DsbL [Burkholderiales bacterium]|nr:thiol:disulfide interchange protein DsbA/DsbL [Burkholderiales bacterium]
MRARPAQALRFLACCCIALAVLPAAAQQLKQDVDYRLIPQQPVTGSGKIEVIEFFWYGCPYCNELQPALEAWLKRKPADVEFRLIPAILHDNWAPHVRIFYTLQALGEQPRLHDQVYYGYHVEKLYMSKPDVMEKWAVDHGIDRQKWLDAYSSPQVSTQIEQAKALTVQYDIQGTPSLVVNGRYLTSGSMVNDIPDLIPILDGLIKMAREQRAAQTTSQTQ